MSEGIASSSLVCVKCEDDEPQGRRDEVLAAIDEFERELAFTAPELIGMRINELRGIVRGIFEEADEDAPGTDDDDGYRQAGIDATPETHDDAEGNEL